MKNYRYRVDNADIILSKEEDEEVKAAIKKGGSIVYLRNDALAINVNFIRYRRETDAPTEREDAERLGVPGLPEFSEETIDRNRAVGEGFRQISEAGFFARMGWRRDAGGHIQLGK